MKKCSKCKEEKSLSEFGKNKRKSDGLQTYCKTCKKEVDKKYYAKNSETQKSQIKKARRNRKYETTLKVIEYFKENPCAHCGEDNPIVLEFDHLADKEHNVSNMINDGLSWDKVKLEIDKCQVLCANCHRIKTAKDRNYLMQQIMHP